MPDCSSHPEALPRETETKSRPSGKGVGTTPRLRPGSCRFGTRCRYRYLFCPFQHEGVEPRGQEKKRCLGRRCKFGTQCKFRHLFCPFHHERIEDWRVERPVGGKRCKFGTHCRYKSLFCPFQHQSGEKERQMQEKEVPGKEVQGKLPDQRGARKCRFGSHCKYRNLFCPFQHQVEEKRVQEKDWEPHRPRQEGKEGQEEVCGQQWTKVPGVWKGWPPASFQASLSRGYGMQGQPPLNSASRGGRTAQNYWSAIGKDKKVRQGRANAPVQKVGSQSAPLPRKCLLLQCF